MQGSFNELNATHQNIRSANMDFQMVSQNFYEDDRIKQAVQFKCSLLDLPEVPDQFPFTSLFKNAPESATPDFLRRQRYSIANISHNSIFNLDNTFMPVNPVFKSVKPETPDSVVESESLAQLKTLWMSRMNIFETENVFEQPSAVSVPRSDHQGGMKLEDNKRNWSPVTAKSQSAFDSIVSVLQRDWFAESTATVRSATTHRNTKT